MLLSHFQRKHCMDPLAFSQVKKFSRDSQFKCLFITLGLIIIHLLGSFAMNGAWLAQTFLNYNGACL